MSEELKAVLFTAFGGVIVKIVEGVFARMSENRAADNQERVTDGERIQILWKRVEELEAWRERATQRENLQRRIILLQQADLEKVPDYQAGPELTECLHRLEELDAEVRK